MKIVSVKVFRNFYGPDKIVLITDLPDTNPDSGHSLHIRFEAPRGTGYDYVKENYGIEPEYTRNGPDGTGRISAYGPDASNLKIFL